MELPNRLTLVTFNRQIFKCMYKGTQCYVIVFVLVNDEESCNDIFIYLFIYFLRKTKDCHFIFQKEHWTTLTSFPYL